MLNLVFISIIINLVFAMYFVIQGIKNKLQIKNTVKILLYNVTQILFCVLLFRNASYTKESFIMVLCMLCIILLSLSFLPLKIFFDGMIEKLNIEEEYEFLLRKEEMDKKYFMMLKEHEEHIARIRHDFINQVSVVGSMVEKNDSNAFGLKLLDELREEVESTRANVYCNNKMINIVVDVMLNQYREHNVNLDVNIVLPDFFVLDEMISCSIIQTLLNEMLSIAQISNEPKTTVAFEIKKVDKNLLFMAQCKNTQMIEKKKCEKIIKSYKKYFERILESYNSAIYSREKEDFIEVILSVSE